MPPNESWSFRRSAAVRRSAASRRGIPATGELILLAGALGQRLVDLAPAVPTINLRTAILVSKRVGNVTHHAQWTTLLDQMWVR